MTWTKPKKTQLARLDYILLPNNQAGRLKYCKIVSCTGEISDHQGVEAAISMDNSPSGPGTFRASPYLEKNLSYKSS